MHKNLAAVQQKMVENARESLKILAIDDQKLMIVPALAAAEKPLSDREIADRTRISTEEIRKGLEYFIERGLVVKSGDALYELNPEMATVAARNIQAKIEALRKNTKTHLAECERLLESAKAEYDGYDVLLSKYLRERIAKMKLITSLMTRRNSLLSLLDSSGEGGTEITKIAIE